ncbi:MAG: response regulator [Deltaproteobacteria bacterium]|nr:response regulator [Deltaproteobacteria bacterium]
MVLKRVKAGRVEEPPEKKSGEVVKDRPRILYVEDNSMNWEITSLELRREYELDWAQDSRTVYQKLKQKTYDLILMDIELSGSDLNGVQITRCLRGQVVDNPFDYMKGLKSVDTPILFLTAYTAKYDSESLAYTGADGVLTKPVDFQQLQKSMMQLIHSKRIIADRAIEQVKQTERVASAKIEEEVKRRELLEEPVGELEGRLAELNRKLEFAQEQLVHGEQLATFGSMIAGIAHELNSPTSAIEFAVGGLSEKHVLIERAIMALFDESPQALELKARFEQMFHDAKESLDIMTVSSGRMLEYCNALQTNARFDTSVVAGVDLNEVVQQSLLISRAKTKPYHIDFKPAAISPLTCKRNHLGQVVINLLSNAADAMAEKFVSGKDTQTGGTIRIRLEDKANLGEAGILLSIEDNGYGVKPELHESIFEGYFTTKRPGAGTGLGLAISQQIVVSHLGKIWVESSPELGGARFCVWLPVAR